MVSALCMNYKQVLAKYFRLFSTLFSNSYSPTLTKNAPGTYKSFAWRRNKTLYSQWGL